MSRLHGIPFAIRNGQYVDITMVEKGCTDCICPICSSKVIIRKGQIKVHHFAHDRSSNCVSAAETTIHLAAKEILNKTRKIYLPPVIFNEFINYDLNYYLKEIKEKQIITFDEVRLEKKHNDFIPDVTGIINNKSLFIEIKVTHAVDYNKIQKIKNAKISCIEINLTPLYDDFKMGKTQITFELLKKIITEEVDNKNWLFNVKLENFANNLKIFGKEYYPEYIKNVSKVKDLYATKLKVIKDRDFIKHPNFVENCPMKLKYFGGQTYYANVHNDCRFCEYNYNKDLQFRSIEEYNPEFVFCLGHDRIEIEDHIKDLKEKYVTAAKKLLRII